MKVLVNGRLTEVGPNESVAGIIVKLELPTSRIAVELNRSVVPRREWESQLLNEDDKVEIIHFVGGG
jgi:sulfur carrier protein